MQYSNNEEQAEFQPETKPIQRMDGFAHEKRKPLMRRILIALLILALSIGGGYFGTMMALENHTISDGTVVIYQTVKRTVEAVKDSEELLSIAEVVQLTADSVVEITTEKAAYGMFMQQYVTAGSGSGVIIDQSGYIATCNHVIENATKVSVRLNDGTEYTAHIVGSDADSDIAVIKIEAKDLTPAVFGNSSEMQVGDTVVAIGNPLGELGGTVTSGILSALDREITIDDVTMNLFQTNAAVNPGNSGGGLFNAYGELIGIVNAKSSGDSIEGLGFAIPLDGIKTIIEELIRQGYVTGKRTLGLTVLNIADAATAREYGVSDYGIYIIKVTRNSLGDSVGFEAKDRILSVNNIEVTSVAELQKLYKNCMANEKVVFKIIRNNQEMSISFIKE